ncbi:MAG: hypothetical protein ABFD07_16595 [Methanobacterium sp.]
MFENLCNIKKAFTNQELPSLHFKGGMKHPLNIIVLPFLVVGVSIIFMVFIVLAVVIDLCNLLIKDQRCKNDL